MCGNILRLKVNLWTEGRVDGEWEECLYIPRLPGAERATPRAQAAADVLDACGRLRGVAGGVRVSAEAQLGERPQTWRLLWEGSF